jgi:hypothetical protein
MIKYYSSYSILVFIDMESKKAYGAVQQFAGRIIRMSQFKNTASKNVTI